MASQPGCSEHEGFNVTGLVLGEADCKPGQGWGREWRRSSPVNVDLGSFPVNGLDLVLLPGE